MSDIKMKQVTREYTEGNGEKIKVLDNLDFYVKQGEMVAITGVSGSGKSTLLHILGCMDTEYKGEYFLGDKLVSHYTKKELAKCRNTRIGFVLQDYNLILGQSVEENVMIPLLFRFGINLKSIQVHVEQVLKRMGIWELRKKKITKLSGGQKQRVAIARAIVGNPTILLADEPTGALDKKTGEHIMDLFRQINQGGTTIIIVTHDMEVSKKCDKIYFMEEGKCKEKEG